MNTKGNKQQTQRMQIRLPESIYHNLVTLSDQNNISKTELIINALRYYFENVEDIKVEETTVDDYMQDIIDELTKIKIRTGHIEKDNQMFAEVLNSLLTKHKFTDDNFIGTQEYENPLIKKSRDYVQKNIAKKKQESDFKKHL